MNIVIYVANLLSLIIFLIMAHLSMPAICLPTVEIKLYKLAIAMSFQNTAPISLIFVTMINRYSLLHNMKLSLYWPNTCC